MPIVTAQAPLPTTQTLSTGVELNLGQAAPLAEVPAAPLATVEDQALSPKFAALARKEKALRLEADRLKSERLKYDEDKKRYETDYIPKSRLTKETMQVLAEAGITPDQLIQMQLNAPGPESQLMLKLQQELDAVKQAQEAAEKQRTEAQQQQYDAALNQIRTDVKSLVAQSEEYETIKALESEEAVVELIKQTFDQDGVVISIDEAAKQVEEHLLERAIRMAGLKKVQAKLAPAPVAANQKVTQPTQKLPQSIKTLTNAAVAAPSGPMTAKQRRDRAIAAFNGQLQSS